MYKAVYMKLGMSFGPATGLKSGISRDMWDTRFLLPQGEVSAESLSRDNVSTAPSFACSTTARKQTAKKHLS